MKFAVFDDSGNPTAFYAEDVHGDRMRPVYETRTRDVVVDDEVVDQEEYQFQIGEEPNPDTRIPPEAVEITDAQWTELVTNPGGRRYVDGSVVLYTPPVTPEVLLSHAERLRKTREQGGLSVPPGVSIATDDRSKLMLMGARVAAEANPDFETPWEDADGNTVLLNATQIIGVSNAVLAHVAGCFAIFASVKAGIANETITSTEEIDAAFAA